MKTVSMRFAEFFVFDWSKASTRATAKFALAACVLLGCWPSVRWYVARLADGSDEPWGALALLAAVCFAGLASAEPLSPRRVVAATAMVSLLLVGASVMTPLIQGVFVMAAIAFLVADSRCWVGHAGLFLLALPVISSLQFYGGFPMRWLIGRLSAWLLSVFGFGVEARGTVMFWRGEMIVIDAPCSGVQMLWSSAFLACLLICIYRLNTRRSLALLQVASASAFVGNVLRNCLLFFVESGLVRVGDWAHSAIGVAVFGLVVASVVWAGRRMSGREIEGPVGGPVAGFGWRHRASAAMLIATLAGVSLSGREAASVLLEGETHRDEVLSGVRERLFAEGWRAESLDARSVGYARKFPGTIELFGKEDRHLVVRVIERATRRYHLSADCYRAIGYAIEPMPLLKDVDGTLWGRTMATRNGESIELRERVVSLDGKSWTDPSSWFWSALFGESQGPWVGYSESVPMRDR